MSSAFAVGLGTPGLASLEGCRLRAHVHEGQSREAPTSGWSGHHRSAAPLDRSRHARLDPAPVWVECGPVQGASRLTRVLRANGADLVNDAWAELPSAAGRGRRAVRRPGSVCHTPVDCRRWASLAGRRHGTRETVVDAAQNSNRGEERSSIAEAGVTDHTAVSSWVMAATSVSTSEAAEACIASATIRASWCPAPPSGHSAGSSVTSPRR